MIEARDDWVGREKSLFEVITHKKWVYEVSFVYAYNFPQFQGNEKVIKCFISNSNNCFIEMLFINAVMWLRSGMTGRGGCIYGRQKCQLWGLEIICQGSIPWYRNTSYCKVINNSDKNYFWGPLSSVSLIVHYLAIMQHHPT